MIPRRPSSRTSSTIPDSSPPSSWSGRMPSSSRTSWSDDGTATAKAEQPLIDFDDDPDFGRNMAREEQEEEQKPGDKLRMLLRQMEEEVRHAQPAKPPPLQASGESNANAGVRTSAWRDGRRRGLARSVSPELVSKQDEMEDSPPTPPPRLSTYLNASRRSADTSKETPQARIPSRAAVLRASISPPQLPQQTTPLETFIRTHPTPPSLPDPSSSRLPNSSLSSSTSSRKGKERALPVPARRDSTSSTSTDSAPASRRRYPSTPRRFSVELAPSSEAFAEEAEGLEVRGEVELDVDLSGEPPWSDQESEALQEEMPPKSPQRRNLSNSKPHAEDSLPDLPRPEETQEEDSHVDTLSSRRATLFRSTSKSPNQTARSNTLSASILRSRELPIPPQAPIQVGMAMLSTPTRPSPKTLEATPHPPGWRDFTPKAKGVRFSPRRDQEPNALSVAEGDVSIHRIKFSPAQRSSPRPSPKGQSKSKADSAAETSFTGRLASLAHSLTGSPSTPSTLPKPSKTLSKAKADLAKLSAASESARAQVDLAQRQWIKALSELTVGDGVRAVGRTAGWSWWIWWIAVELLLAFMVFRVTLDFATSQAYLSHLSPFALPPSSPAAGNLGLSIPLPTAVSAFVVKGRRGSANFFDLLEGLDIWGRLDGWDVSGEGILRGGAGGRGWRLGVPL